MVRLRLPMELALGRSFYWRKAKRKQSVSKALSVIGKKAGGGRTLSFGFLFSGGFSMDSKIFPGGPPHISQIFPQGLAIIFQERNLYHTSGDHLVHE